MIILCDDDCNNKTNKINYEKSIEEILRYEPKINVKKIYTINLVDYGIRKKFFINPKVSNKPGVYVLINGMGYKYIGMSINIRSRLTSHVINKFYGPVLSVIIFETNCKFDASLERDLIRYFVPELNRYI